MNDRDRPVRSGRGAFLSLAMDRGRSLQRLLQDDLRAFKLEELAALQMVVDRRASRASREEVDDALQAVDQARAHQARVQQLLCDERAGRVQDEHRLLHSSQQRF